MKKIFYTLCLMMICMTFSSCVVTETYASDDYQVGVTESVSEAETDISIVIRLGTPYYYNGSLIYYLYKGWYYYPYYYRDYWYWRPSLRCHPYGWRYRPSHSDYRWHRGNPHRFDRRPHNHSTRPYHNGFTHNFGNRPQHRGNPHNFGTRPQHNGSTHNFGNNKPQHRGSEHFGGRR